MDVAYIHVHGQQRYFILDSTPHHFDRRCARIHEQRHYFDFRNFSGWNAFTVDKRLRAEISEWNILRCLPWHLHDFELWICYCGIFWYVGFETKKRNL